MTTVDVAIEVLEVDAPVRRMRNVFSGTEQYSGHVSEVHFDDRGVPYYDVTWTSEDGKAISPMKAGGFYDLTPLLRKRVRVNMMIDLEVDSRLPDHEVAGLCLMHVHSQPGYRIASAEVLHQKP